jgi:iron complex outermembrane receptor protein
VLTVKQIQTTGPPRRTRSWRRWRPSFNFPRPTLSDGADTVRPATLRGLGPDHVLVLVNGKRRHQSAHVATSGVIGRGTTGVDLNAIPASAIAKIEVLRDGAAAQYGFGRDRGRHQHRAEVRRAAVRDRPARPA